MRIAGWIDALVGLLLCNCAQVHVEPTARMIGVSDPVKAEFHWVMHCRGCHGANAEGSEKGAPRMAGAVARFLHHPRGRAYLARVPGVAFVELSDRDVAQLLNWVVQHYDAGNLPENFVSYDEVEVKTLRQDPLISNGLEERAKVLQELGNVPEATRANDRNRGSSGLCVGDC
jgi:cytochrome c553